MVESPYSDPGVNQICQVQSLIPSQIRVWTGSEDRGRWKEANIRHRVFNGSIASVAGNCVEAHLYGWNLPGRLTASKAIAPLFGRCRTDRWPVVLLEDMVEISDGTTRSLGTVTTAAGPYF